MTTNEMRQVLDWKDEGKLQYDAGEDVWVDFSNRGCISLRECFESYRRKPEPKLRPWKPDEVPVGALIRYKGVKSCVTIIVAVLNDGRIKDGAFECGGKSEYDCEYAFFTCEHSTDNGKTWKPCGVEE